MAGTPWGDTDLGGSGLVLSAQEVPDAEGRNDKRWGGDAGAREAAGRGGIPVFCLSARARNPLP